MDWHFIILTFNIFLTSLFHTNQVRSRKCFNVRFIQVDDYVFIKRSMYVIKIKMKKKEKERTFLR